MQKFSLFKKSKKFYWSTNKIIYSILFFCCLIMLFKLKVLNIVENQFDKVFIWIPIGIFCFGLVLKLNNMSKSESLHGNLEGYLSFENDFIKVNEEIILIEKIRNIQISNNDYIGKLVNFSKGNFGPALSNGTNNFIIIFLESGKTIKYQFEMINSDDFQKIRKTLIDYYIQKKIDFWELANVLEEKSSEEIAELTKEIEEISSSAKLSENKSY